MIPSISKLDLVLFRTVIACCFIVLGIWSFGNAELFDRAFYACLIFTALINMKDVNILGILIIILFSRTIDELAWQVITNLEWQALRIPIYAILGIVLWFGRHDPTFRYLSIFLWCICVASEIYWYFVGYKAPQLYWYLFTMSLALIVRHLIFLRTTLTVKLGVKSSILNKEIQLDWEVYKVVHVTYIVQLLVLIEFLIRHLLGFHILVVYKLSPAIMHVLAIYTMYLVFEANYKHMSNKQIVA